MNLKDITFSKDTLMLLPDEEIDFLIAWKIMGWWPRLRVSKFESLVLTWSSNRALYGISGLTFQTCERLAKFSLQIEPGGNTAIIPSPWQPTLSHSEMTDVFIKLGAYKWGFERLTDSTFRAFCSHPNLNTELYLSNPVKEPMRLCAELALILFERLSKESPNG